MGKEIIVELKNVRGVEKACPIDKTFAAIHEALTGRKTLTDSDVLCYARLGYTLKTNYQNNSFSFDITTNEWIVTSL